VKAQASLAKIQKRSCGAPVRRCARAAIQRAIAGKAETLRDPNEFHETESESHEALARASLDTAHCGECHLRSAAPLTLEFCGVFGGDN